MWYYYQIKGLNSNGNWAWPPVASGRKEAANTKEAREKLEQEYGVSLPMGRLKKEGSEQHYLLCLEEMDNKPYLKERFEEKSCKNCGTIYTLQDKYFLNEISGRDFCCGGCQQEFKNKEGIEGGVNFDFDGVHNAVIYKITNKTTGGCYIGKTTQAFTLRWYQHFFAGSGTKFHEAIRKYGVTDWTFEVEEVIELPTKPSLMPKTELQRIMNEREMFYIKKYNSIKRGYNTTPSKKDTAPGEHVLELFEGKGE